MRQSSTSGAITEALCCCRAFLLAAETSCRTSQTRPNHLATAPASNTRNPLPGVVEANVNDFQHAQCAAAGVTRSIHHQQHSQHCQYPHQVRGRLRYTSIGSLVQGCIATLPLCAPQPAASLATTETPAAVAGARWGGGLREHGPVPLCGHKPRLIPCTPCLPVPAGVVGLGQEHVEQRPCRRHGRECQLVSSNCQNQRMPCQYFRQWWLLPQQQQPRWRRTTQAWRTVA